MNELLIEVIAALEKKAQLEEYVEPMVVEEQEESQMIETLEDIKTDPQYVQDNKGYWDLLEQYDEGDPIWTKISEYQNLPLEFVDQFSNKIDFDLLLNTNKEFAYDGTTVEDFFDKGYIDAYTVVNDHPDVAEVMLSEEQGEDYVEEMVEDMPLLDTIIDEVVVVDDLEDISEVIEDLEELPVESRLMNWKLKLKRIDAQIDDDIDLDRDTITYEKYGPGKFSDNVQEFMYDIVLNGFSDDSIGSVDELGTYDLIVLAKPFIVTGDQEWTFSAAIVSEGSQGFVDVEYFDTEAEAREAWSGIEEEYSKFYDEVGMED